MSAWGYANEEQRLPALEGGGIAVPSRWIGQRHVLCHFSIYCVTGDGKMEKRNDIVQVYIFFENDGGK
jgi:hypothetical protein